VATIAPRGQRDAALLILAAVAAAQLVVLAPALVYPDLNLDYPYLGGDGRDWIGNALAWLGHDVNHAARPPVLPWLLAALTRLGIAPFFPVINLAVFLATLIGLYLVIRDRFPHRAAFVAVAALLVDFSLVDLALDVMADVLAASLLFSGLALLGRARERNGVAFASGLLLGLSAVTQQIALVVPIAVGVAWTLLPRHRPRRRALVAAVVGFAPLPLAWLGAKAAIFGSAGDVGQRQWSLLRLHVDDVGHYVFAAASLLGVAGLIAACAGAILLARKVVAGAAPPQELVAAAIMIAFFVFLYDFPDKRFLVYLAPFAGIFIGEALAAVRSAAVFWALSAVVVATAAVPLPARGGDPRYAALWPLPPRLLVSATATETTGAQRATLRELRLVSPGLQATLGAALPVRAWRDRRALVPSQLFQGEGFGPDRGAICLTGEGAAPGDRYQLTGLVSNALLLRTKYFPAELIAAHTGLLAPLACGSVAGRTLLRTPVAGLPGTWVLVWPPGLTLPDAASVSPPSAEELATAAADAAAARAFIEDRERIVVFPSQPRRVRLAAFLLAVQLRTHRVYVGLDGGEPIASVVARLPDLDSAHFGQLTVRKTEMLDQAGALVFERD
jgi:4-amino-4-deoxy-L-arabinose transferase-like glycosyltransferase